MFKYKNQRVGVFVDVSNMYHSAKNLYGARVNFKEILKAVTDGRQMIRAIAYTVKTSGNDEDNFFEALDKSGFEVKTKDLQVFIDGTKKADWDVGLAVDAITLADRLDSIIIVSGDGDYVPLLEYLQMTGQFTETLAFGKSCSGKIKELTDYFIDLDENPRKFLMPIRK